jgi:hypothetical protein
MASFSTTLASFCDELKQTFPELEQQISRAVTLGPDQYFASWAKNLPILLARDADALFAERKGFIIGSVRLTPALWAEISENTRAAIWKYLRTLVLESAMGLSDLSAETMQTLMEIIVTEKSGGSMESMMDKLKEMMGADLSGMAMPEIPERLRNGRIAKLAEEMAKQFDPAEFGIDPALLSGDNVEEILKRLMDIYKRDPTMLVNGARRVAEKIKKQIQGGSLNRDDLIAEAQEYVALFKNHPMAKGFLNQSGLAEMFSGLGGSETTPSERRRTVQERLRKKLAERQAATKR